MRSYLGNGTEYRGDSPSKKFARILLWQKVSALLGRRFKKGRHLVLPSAEAGDISILQAYGVPLKNILAVDWNPEALLSASRAFPGLPMAFGEVGEVIQEGGFYQDFDCAFLDFCGTLSGECVKSMKYVASTAMSENSVFACTFLVGRERGSCKDDILTLAAKFDKKQYSHDKKIPRYLARAEQTHILLHNSMRNHWLHPQREAMIFYSSMEPDLHGLPMCTYICRLVHEPKDFAPSIHVVRKTEEDVQNAIRENLCQTTLDLLNIYGPQAAAWKAKMTRDRQRAELSRDKK